MVLKQKKETEGLGRSASSSLTAKAGASTIRNAGISQYSQTQLLFPKQSQCNRFDVLNAFHTTNIQYLLYVCKCTMCVFLHSLVKFINHKHIWEHFVSYRKCCCFPSNSPSYRMIRVHVHHFSHNLRGEGQMLNNFLFKQF